MVFAMFPIHVMLYWMFPLHILTLCLASKGSKGVPSLKTKDIFHNIL
jgi:hypothetical protein